MIITDYLDLKAIPQEEMTEDLIISELMMAIHHLLISSGLKGNIGVGFPNYNLNKRLGGIIRLFASTEVLQQFDHYIRQDHLIRDYALVTPIKRVPDNVDDYVMFSRWRPKTISKSQVKRYQKRHPEEWSNAVCEYVLSERSLPFGIPHFKAKSSSTGQAFTIWVKRHSWDKHNQRHGVFDSYGLSKTAAVPIF